MIDMHHTNLINPHRGAGDKFLLYTEHEGGEYKILGGWDEEQYTQLIMRGSFHIRIDMGNVQVISPAYAALLVCVDGFDFRLHQLNNNNHGDPFSPL